MYWDILSKKQRRMLKGLEVYRKFGAYLAGGTALALQLGHRLSLDFDFYTKKEFEPDMLEKFLVKSGLQITTSQKAYGTLTGQINGVSVSCFYYDYPLIKPSVKTEHLDLASVEDISAMKIVAISQRGKRRDFLDIFVLAKKFGLDELIRFAHKKYPKLDNYMLLRGLTYFADAEKKDERDALNLIETVSWDKIKSYIVHEAVRIKKNFL